MSENLQNAASSSQPILSSLIVPPEVLPNSEPLILVTKVDVSDLNFTDEQFEQLSKANPEWKIEMNGKAELIIMPSTGFITGVKNNDLSFFITLWARNDGTGLVADSSTTYILPNGARRSPDVSWLQIERLKNFSEAQLQKFVPLAPDFVIELRSPTDSLKELKDKMTEYVENGVRLGWLVDPSKKQVYIYRPNTEVQILENPSTLSGEDVLTGFTLDLTEIWSTKIV